MQDTIHVALTGWANFYLVTGTAAATLTGLQFIVQTLLASEWMSVVHQGDTEGGIAAFATPTVVHFSLALVISAVLCAPWSSYAVLRIMLGALGVGALVYAAIVFARTRRQQSYETTAYDWFWYILMPVVAYAALLIGVIFGRGAAGAFEFVAVGTLLLICVGIHNAWDTVTYLTITAVKRSR